MAKPLKWTLGLLLSLVLLILLAAGAALIFFHSEAGKNFVEDKASDALGRELKIQGDMDVDLSLTPLVTLTDITLANAGWSDSPFLAEAESVTFQLDLQALFSGQILMPTVTITNSQALLERSDNGVRNWTFSSGEKRGDADDSPPEIRKFILKNAKVRYQNPVFAKGPLGGTIDNLRGELDREARHVALTADGEFEGKTFSADLGSESGTSGDPYPLNGAITLGDTTAQLGGTLTEPLSLKSWQLQVALDMPEPHTFASLLGYDLEAWPRLRLEAALTFDNQLWRATGIDGQLGESDLGGSLAYSYAKPLPSITADLHANSLDLEKLSANLGDAGEAARKLSERPLRSIRFPSETLNKANVELKFAAQSLLILSANLQNVVVEASLMDGHLQGRRLEFGIDGGTVNAEVDIKSAKVPIEIAFAIDANKLDLRKVLAGFDIDKEGFGAIDARAELSGSGVRVQDFLATAQGDVTAIMESGRLDSLMVQLAGQGVFATLEAFLGSERATAELRCLVADWKVGKGLAEVQRLVIDTADTKVVGGGQVNLVTGQVDLELLPRAKDFSLLSAQAPMHVRGSIRDPELSVDGDEVMSSLLTPVELGDNEDANCQQLAAAARRSF